MILVTVGSSWAFDRLVRTADELAARLDEPMIIQRGESSHVPQHAQYVDTVDGTQMQDWLSEARVVVAHAGAGTILSVLQAGKPLVIVPRVARFGEVIDDHQFELAEALESRGWVVMVTDLSVESLAEAIAHAPQRKQDNDRETRLHSTVRTWLAEQAARPPARLWRSLHRKHHRA